MRAGVRYRVRDSTSGAQRWLGEMRWKQGVQTVISSVFRGHDVPARSEYPHFSLVRDSLIAMVFPISK